MAQRTSTWRKGRSHPSAVGMTTILSKGVILDSNAISMELSCNFHGIMCVGGWARQAC